MLSNIAKGYLNKVFFKLPQLIKKNLSDKGNK